MDLAAKLQKLSRGDPRALPAEQAVEMATIGGARALHMQQQIGSLEVGKKADVILVDTGLPSATPLYNVYAHIVYSMKAADVDTTIIGGKIVMDHRHVLTMNEAEVLAKAGEYAKKVAASLATPPVQ
jgi:5-methylthioadenosine/S-adenosylhomocysteine deaminase